ncbi:MAG TPA: hypothetical protein VEQ18_01935 [Candidatus Nitrosocosmicus sp.]|nr:hypothetical protein [Candidatus Nitrosocosmicus sp.]
MIDGYMHERANVMKHAHASARDENPNLEEDIPQDDVPEASSVPEPSSSTPSLQGKKKTEKLATQDAVAVMAEQSKELTKVVRESEAAKLALLQGMLATMGELVKKL